VATCKVCQWEVWVRDGRARGGQIQCVPPFSAGGGFSLCVTLPCTMSDSQPQTRDPPASASPVLELDMCVTMLTFCSCTLWGCFDSKATPLFVCPMLCIQVQVRACLILAPILFYLNKYIASFRYHFHCRIKLGPKGINLRRPLLVCLREACGEDESQSWHHYQHFGPW
jgi:hypothetical protein